MQKIQAVILAAGSSVRTQPLTSAKPKPLLKAAGRSIIRHNLGQLKDFVDEAIVVVGYKKEMIMDELGEEFDGIRMVYVEQKQQLGTAHALMQARDRIKGKFIVMNGDDFYHRDDIGACLRHEMCVLVQEVRHPERFGVYTVDGSRVKRIVEKPRDFVSNLANTGVYVFTPKIFEVKIEKSSREEYEITDYINKLAEKEAIDFERVSNFWLPVGYPWDLLKANEHFLNELGEQAIRGAVEEGATVKGPVSVGEGTLIKSGAYIEGPVMIGRNCNIGPNCFIRGKTTIGDNCIIGNAVEVKNSIIMDNTNVCHLSYIGDSVIGENVNIGAGSIAANLRHDGETVKSLVNGELVDSCRRKLGTIIGDNCRIGINTIIYPGRKIWPNRSTLPGEIVKEDIRQNTEG